MNMNLDFQEIKLLNRNFDFIDQINRTIIYISKPFVNSGVLHIEPDASRCQDCQGSLPGRGEGDRKKKTSDWPGLAWLDLARSDQV